MARKKRPDKQRVTHAASLIRMAREHRKYARAYAKDRDNLHKVEAARISYDAASMVHFGTADIFDAEAKRLRAMK